MESCKPFSQTLASSISTTFIAEPDNSMNEPFGRSSEKPNSVSELTPNGFLGSLEIFIHQARDIQNICIYHKQDVYAKLYLTNNPESSISTEIINGGGSNPIFNESAKLNVQSIDSSLKCEIWMLSRVKNYLEDQLLGFSLVPLSEILMGNGKLAREFSLSSSDLFHSPSGFVQLSLSYTGSAPEVMVIQEPAASAIEDTFPCEYEKIEFPDLKVVNENKMMVSEYFRIPCTGLDSQNVDDAGAEIVESFSTKKNDESLEFVRDDTPLEDNVSPSQRSRDTEVAEGGSVSSTCMPETEKTVVQQEIVDMYMKSMKQFTESLANMKLPMEVENSSSMENGKAASGKKLEVSKNGSGRVFYGSRAFF